jgi:hypothetical protein
MFQLFLRARVHQYFGGRVTNRDFRARAPGRDAETDRARVESILLAIEASLTAAEAEQSGLSRRVEDVLARAAVTIGNDSDEYLTREPLDSHHQDLFDIEISNGQRRLRELAVAISHFRFLKAAILSRFPDFKSTTGAQPVQPFPLNPQ